MFQLAKGFCPFLFRCKSQCIFTLDFLQYQNWPKQFSACPMPLAPAPASVFCHFSYKCGGLWSNAARWICRMKDAEDKLSRKIHFWWESWAGRCRKEANSQTKSVLQNEMRESSETQMCVAEKAEDISFFSLEMMDWRPDDGRGCRKYKIIYRRKRVWLWRFSA